MDFKLCAERIESEKSLGVVTLRNEYRVITNNVNCIQDAVDKLHNEKPPSKMLLSPHKAGKSVGVVQLSVLLTLTFLLI